jgi:carboxymethylenebutenolidase
MDRIKVMNLVTSYQLGQISRRQFMRHAVVALGSISTANLLLAACQAVPIGAPSPTLIQTPASDPEAAAPTALPAQEGEGSDGLITEPVTYPDRDGESLTGYLARPADGDPRPAIVVIQEWWGLDEHILDLTRRFASEGYVVIAPDLYHGAVATEPDEARKLVMELDMQQAVVEIQQAIEFLLAQEYVSGEKVGVIGFCMGGGLALQTAVASDRVAAAIPFYGNLLSPEQAAQVQAPVQAHYGTADRFDLDALQEMVEIIEDETGHPSEAHIYEDAPHAFFNDTSQSYRAEAAELAWQRTLDWFSTHLQ